MLFYLSLAVFLALTLNAGNRWWRLAGTLAAAAALVMMVWSIILADLDGTLGALPVGERWRAVLLNGEAALGAVATLFLLWAAWAQLRRPAPTPLGWTNDGLRYGRISRYGHWASVVLVLAALPMGLFLTVLPQGPTRSEFATIHHDIGIALLVIVTGRLLWLLVSPPPQTSRGARAVQVALYGLILLFPLSGLLLARGGPWPLLHARLLPVALYAGLIAHIGAALRWHFLVQDRAPVRRMLR